MHTYIRTQMVRQVVPPECQEPSRQAWTITTVPKAQAKALVWPRD